MGWLWYVGTSQIRALHVGLLAIFPKAAPASHYPCACARSQQQLLVSFKDFCEQACLETPRPVKAKACQQPKGPASSSKESPRLGITWVLCLGTQHLFLETGAAGVTRQPNQVALPGLLPGTSDTHFHAKAYLVPAWGFPKPYSFLAFP